MAQRRHDTPSPLPRPRRRHDTPSPERADARSPAERENSRKRRRSRSRSRETRRGGGEHPPDAHSGMRNYDDGVVSVNHVEKRVRKEKTEERSAPSSSSASKRKKQKPGKSEKGRKDYPTKKRDKKKRRRREGRSEQKRRIDSPASRGSSAGDIDDHGYRHGSGETQDRRDCEMSGSDDAEGAALPRATTSIPVLNTSELVVATGGGSEGGRGDSTRPLLTLDEDAPTPPASPSNARENTFEASSTPLGNPSRIRPSQDESPQGLDENAPTPRDQQGQVEPQIETAAGKSSFFAQLRATEEQKGTVGTVHATGGRSGGTAVEPIKSSDWECLKCGKSNYKNASACDRCHALKRMTLWRD